MLFCGYKTGIWYTSNCSFSETGKSIHSLSVRRKQFLAFAFFKLDESTVEASAFGITVSSEIR